MPAERQIRRRPRFKAQSAIRNPKSAITLLALLAGCAAQTANYQPRPDPTTPESALVVLHVTGESDLRAGTPIERRDFATVIDSSDSWAVVAEGAPAPGTFYNLRLGFLGSASPISLPKPAFFHDNIRVHLTNVLCMDVALTPGQCVQIAGFAKPATGTSAAQSLSASAIEQSASVIAPDQLASGLQSAPIDEHLIWLLAPPGDYAAFRGGPVAIIRTGQPPCVVALIFNQIQNDPARGAILSAVPLKRLIQGM